MEGCVQIRLSLVLSIGCALAGIRCASSPTAPSTPAGVTTIAFAGVTAAGPVTIVGENGYSISVAGPWQGVATFGSPAPMIQFVTPAGAAQSASLQVFANDHAAFTFRSVDLYSSITPIPYTITGARGSTVVFVMADTIPNTFGTFRTVSSTHANDAIDTLTIDLRNPMTCCPNPIGVDTIVLAR